jgi:hypothetical protein
MAISGTSEGEMCESETVDGLGNKEDTQTGTSAGSAWQRATAGVTEAESIQF